jgi:DNA-binding NarL/FixJ family response regulator
MYVIADSGDVLLSPADSPELDAGTRHTACRLIGSAGSRSAVFGLSDEGRVLRLVQLAGKSAGAHYALFVEDVVSRSPLDDAVTRYSLSDREREVLAELLRGSSTADIALRLVIGESTVATHVRNIGTKMRASKRKEIVAAVLGHR